MTFYVFFALLHTFSRTMIITSTGSRLSAVECRLVASMSLDLFAGGVHTRTAVACSVVTFASARLSCTSITTKMSITDNTFLLILRHNAFCRKYLQTAYCCMDLTAVWCQVQYLRISYEIIHFVVVSSARILQSISRH